MLARAFLSLMLMLSLAGCTAAPTVDDPVDLGDPPTFTATQLTAAIDGAKQTDLGCYADLPKTGPVTWQLIPATCDSGKQNGVPFSQGSPTISDEHLDLDYAQTGDVGRAFTELDTMACTNACEKWQSHAVVYRIRTADLDAHLVGWVAPERADEEAWRAWAERSAVDLTR